RQVRNQSANLTGTGHLACPSRVSCWTATRKYVGRDRCRVANTRRSGIERGAGRRANLVFGSERARHWVQCEAPGAFNAALVEGLDALAAERVREEHRQ